MRLITALLASSFLLMGATCQERPDPPSAVEVKVAVPVPCQVQEPSCAAPAYDSAKKDQDGDFRIRVLRAETSAYWLCVKLYREALAACRQVEQKP